MIKSLKYLLLISHITVFFSSISQNGLQFGLCHAGTSNTEKEYSLVKELGARWVRVDFSWNKLEPQKGNWNFSKYDAFLNKANEEGIKVLAILNYDANWLHKGKDQSRRIDLEELPHFLNYVEVVGKRYGTKVSAFEIWNEPNTKRFWTGSNLGFFELSNQSLNKLKEVAPNTPVAIGSLFYHPILSAKSYLKKMINNVDVNKASAISLHPYSINISKLNKRITKAKELISSNGHNIPIWITEIGFPTGGLYPSKINLDEQANIVSKSLIYLTKAGSEIIYWYCLFDSNNKEKTDKKKSSEDFFGLAWPNYKLKPGATSFSTIAKELNGATYNTSNIQLETNKPNSIFHALYKSKNDSDILVIWSKKKQSIVKINDRSIIKCIDLLTGKTIKLNNLKEIKVTNTPLLIHLD
jgi:GH35 family endo-1,4-beta-xylanase